MSLASATEPEFLQKAFEKGRVPHAMLFSGPAGAGQMEAARSFAERLLGPFGEAHPDFYVLQPEGKTRSIPIERVRELTGRAALRPLQARCSVFVIDEARQMREDAQSALLKTLEEPPGHAYFILIAPDAGALMATVRSRCQTVHFRPAETEPELDAELVPMAGQAAAFLDGAGGCPPDFSKLDRDEAGRLLEHLVRQYRARMVEAAAKGADAEAAIALVERLARAKERITGQFLNPKLAWDGLWIDAE